jgi:hypothetical protein
MQSSLRSRFKVSTQLNYKYNTIYRYNVNCGWPEIRLAAWRPRLDPLTFLASSVATFLCLWAISISPLGPDGPYPYGFYIFGGLIALAVVVHFLLPRDTT